MVSLADIRYTHNTRELAANYTAILYYAIILIYYYLLLVVMTALDAVMIVAHIFMVFVAALTFAVSGHEVG